MKIEDKNNLKYKYKDTKWTKSTAMQENSKLDNGLIISVYQFNVKDSKKLVMLIHNSTITDLNTKVEFKEMTNLTLLIQEKYKSGDQNVLVKIPRKETVVGAIMTINSRGWVYKYNSTAWNAKLSPMQTEMKPKVITNQVNLHGIMDKKDNTVELFLHNTGKSAFLLRKMQLKLNDCEVVFAVKRNKLILPHKTLGEKQLILRLKITGPNFNYMYNFDYDAGSTELPCTYEQAGVSIKAYYFPLRHFTIVTVFNETYDTKEMVINFVQLLDYRLAHSHYSQDKPLILKPHSQVIYATLAILGKSFLFKPFPIVNSVHFEDEDGNIECPEEKRFAITNSLPWDRISENEDDDIIDMDDAKKREEERRKKEEEERQAEEERKRIEEEERKREEEARRIREEQARIRKEEEEARRIEEERLRKEKEEKERQRQEEEKARKIKEEKERQRRLEEIRRQKEEQERKRKEEERKRKAEEQRRQREREEAERNRKIWEEQERKRMEEERRQKREQERKRKEKERKRKEEERKRKAEEERRRRERSESDRNRKIWEEQERIRLEEERREQERARRRKDNKKIKIIVNNPRKDPAQIWKNHPQQHQVSGWVQDIIDKKARYIDTDFPKNKDSSYLRVGKVLNNPKLFVDRIEADDIRQGSLGDCWLLAAFGGIAERYPEKIVEAFIVRKENEAGIYEFRLFHPTEKKWKRIVVDDTIKTIHSGRYPKYSKSNNNEFWVMLLEKACAKLMGSFETLIGGFCRNGVAMITGNTKYKYVMRDRGLNEKNFPQWFNGSNLVYTSFIKNNLKLITSHAFMILDYKEHKKVTLIKVRNPWGKGEWNGPYCDGDKKWTKSLIEFCGYEDKVDGNFWMP
eukprot:CAMPEP_0117429026 /NCGR_PEP_ID=MMETSP0758-20121206/8607_1 /TAXON_ID=63605 /ORGANISM="Percolomonas cosmopolitus, Strain AE-1 (ATCC 50343)" /LENGTH=861 /DNA_ID=CAMNT_0005215717 /DNA_START=179 /DNA_END=2760 /DNA_ORIENTATION=-